MTEKKNIKISKYLSLILRHKPEEVKIILDKNGWCNVNELIDKINSKWEIEIDFTLLEYTVDNNPKKRFSFNENHTKIRANQWHSIKVDLNLKKQIPPDILYHGTSLKNIKSIKEKWIIKWNRHHVHLSEIEEQALMVWQRHWKAIVLKINSKIMHNDKISFYISENNVRLTEYISPKYIEI